ncbi:MAG: zinc ribbon domain-containing protein, partial [Anaerolineae bacterium]
ILTDKVNYRPDLQIISVDQFERVRELVKSRKVESKNMGARGHYLFTGFVACGCCGGPTVAARAKGRDVVYQCVIRRKYGAQRCATGKTYTEHLLLPPIIDFLAGFIQEQIDFYTALDTAAAQYGKSVTEEAIEAAIQGELASVQAGKQRLIEAISLGILTHQEAAVKLVELRQQEQRLTVELSSIAEKTAIMAQWQEALNALKGQDITGRLFDLAEQKPIVFRRLLSLVFEPNSLRVRTWNEGKKWVGALDSYKLTETMQNLSISFDNKVKRG